MKTYKLPAGTKVRTIFGESATLVADWYAWEASVTVRTAFGVRETYHPTKVYLTGKALDYQP